MISSISLAGIPTQIKLQDFSMCIRPHTKDIFVVGGNLESYDRYTADERKKSTAIYCISTENEAIEKIVLKDEPLEKNLGVSSAFLTFYGPNTLVIFCGSEPTLG